MQCRLFLFGKSTEAPVYYTSKVMYDAETRCSVLEKLAFALVTTARRLKVYFQEHPIVVLTDQPIKQQVLQKPDLSGRLAKWAIELGEFGMEFQPKKAIKAQALADFIAEMSFPISEVPNDTEMMDANSEETWTAFVDGSSSKSGRGAGILILGLKLAYAIRFKFLVSNNVAEYEVTALKVAIPLKSSLLIVYSDSQLVISQINGDFEAREPRMAKYLAVVQSLLQRFNNVTVLHVPREENHLMTL